MKPNFKRIALWALVLVTVLGRPDLLVACATCYGASDSPLAQGMNWGIMTLLGFVATVLGGIVGFFVHLGVRSRRASSVPPQYASESGIK